MGSIGRIIFGSKPKTKIEQLPSVMQDPAMEAFYRDVLPTLFGINAEGERVQEPPQSQLGETLRRHINLSSAVFRELEKPFFGSLASVAGREGGTGLGDLLANKIAMEYYVNLPLRIATPYIQGRWSYTPVVTQTGGSPGLLGAILPGIGSALGLGLGARIGKIIGGRI